MQLQPNSSRPAAPADLAEAVVVVFSTVTRLFPASPRWAEVAADRKSLRTWERAFDLAKLTPSQVLSGLARLSQSPSPYGPPSAGQFIALCRPPLPTEADGLREALEWSRGSGGEWPWSHPVVGATAQQIGAWQLRNARPTDLSRLWSTTMRDMAERFARGESLELPCVRALPAPPPDRVQQIRRDLGLPDSISEESDRASRCTISAIAAWLGSAAAPSGAGQEGAAA